MARYFSSLGQFALYLATQAKKGYENEIGKALDQIGAAIKHQVEQDIGQYQPGIDQYPAWAPLKPSTLETKARYNWGKGGNPDTPLYATGAFASDIGFSTNKKQLAVTIGSNKDYILYTEFGTRNMAPRPVFGPAALKVLPKFVPLIGKYAAAGISGITVNAGPVKSYGSTMFTD